MQFLIGVKGGLNLTWWLYIHLTYPCISYGRHLKIKQTIALAIEPTIVKRGIKYAIIVGTILVGINHGDSFLKGSISGYQWCQITLTYAVPYIVSSLSSVQAILNNKTMQNTEQS